MDVCVVISSINLLVQRVRAIVEGNAWLYVSEFDDALKKREHEFRVQIDEMNAKVLEYDLKVGGQNCPTCLSTMYCSFSVLEAQSSARFADIFNREFKAPEQSVSRIVMNFPVNVFMRDKGIL